GRSRVARIPGRHGDWLRILVGHLLVGAALTPARHRTSLWSVARRTVGARTPQRASTHWLHAQGRGLVSGGDAGVLSALLGGVRQLVRHAPAVRSGYRVVRGTRPARGTAGGRRASRGSVLSGISANRA